MLRMIITDASGWSASVRSCGSALLLALLLVPSRLRLRRPPLRAGEFAVDLAGRWRRQRS